MKPFYDTEERIERLQFACGLWFGTPFRKSARVMRRGVDCVNLAIAVYNDSGFALSIDLPHYHLDEGVHSKDSKVLHWLSGSEKFLRVDSMKPGDLVCFRLNQSIHHVGIVVDEHCFFHCVQDLGSVFSRLEDSTYRVDDSKEGAERERLVAIFRPVES